MSTDENITLHKKTIKIIELVKSNDFFHRIALLYSTSLVILNFTQMLGATTLGFKYHKLQELTQGDFYSSESVQNHSLPFELLFCITYFGLLFLKSMAVISAISGQIPKGNYVRICPFYLNIVAIYFVDKFMAHLDTRLFTVTFFLPTKRLDIFILLVALLMVRRKDFY